MRRREVGLALVVTALAVGVAFQASADSRTLRGLDRTSFVAPGAVTGMALATGVLGGDPRGCLWLEADGGRTPLVVRHPSAGVDHTTKPPVVRTLDAVVVRFGDALAVGGGFDREAVAPACAGLGTPFVVDAEDLNLR